MPVRSVYFDGCPTAHALDLVGDRWALLIVRELLLGPKRFTDLGRGLPRISRNVLSQRLTDLQVAGVLRRRTLPPPSASTVYELTDRGYELESVLQAIGRWGARSASLPVSDSLGVDTFVLGLRSRYSSAAAKHLNARYELRVGEEAFDFHIVDGDLSILRGASERPTLVVTVDRSDMAAVARGERPLAMALSAAADDSARLSEFVALFSGPNEAETRGLNAPSGRRSSAGRARDLSRESGT